MAKVNAELDKENHVSPRLPLQPIINNDKNSKSQAFFSTGEAYSSNCSLHFSSQEIYYIALISCVFNEIHTKSRQLGFLCVSNV